MGTKKEMNFQKLLWSVSGLDPEVLGETKVDRHHASIIGLLLVMVGCYAVFAWSFFFQTATNSTTIAWIGGLFMGLFIVILDRALIASLASGKTKSFSLIFRLALALLLGIFLSQPIILKLYQPEIQRESQVLKDEKSLDRRKELEKEYALVLSNEKGKQEKYKTQIDQKQLTLAEAEKDFKVEMDGTGGTLKRGYSSIAKQKEKIYLAHLNEYENLNKSLPLKIENSQMTIDSIYGSIDNAMLLFNSENKTAGTLMQVAALHSILDKDETGTLRSRYYLLSLILILIELSALIAKLLFKMETYKSKIQFAIQTDLKTISIEHSLANKRLEEFEKLALKSNLKAQEHFITEAEAAINDKVGHIITEWKEDNGGSLKQHWKKLMEKIMLS